MEFRRFVSYVYVYQDNVRQQNCGFVRVEVRQNTARFAVHMYLPQRYEEEYRIYGFIRKGKALEGILLGAGRVKNGNVDVRLQMPSQSLGVGQAERAEDAVSIEQLSGMVVKGSDHTCYGTVWDEGEIDMEAFRERTAEEPEESIREEPEESIREEPEESIREELEESIREEPAKAVKPDEKTAEEVSGNRETTTEAAQEAGTAAGGRVAEETSAGDQTDGEIKVQEYQEEIDWAVLQRSCPVIVPFETDRGGEYLRIEPKDLKYLPRKLWHLGRNSFLLHGYYNYRYLILGRDKDGVILGVPGIYCPMEENVAAMFGFRTFIPAVETARQNGKFGYWCGRIYR